MRPKWVSAADMIGDRLELHTLIVPLTLGYCRR